MWGFSNSSCWTGSFDVPRELVQNADSQAPHLPLRRGSGKGDRWLATTGKKNNHRSKTLVEIVHLPLIECGKSVQSQRLPSVQNDTNGAGLWELLWIRNSES